MPGLLDILDVERIGLIGQDTRAHGYGSTNPDGQRQEGGGLHPLFDCRDRGNALVGRSRPYLEVQEQQPRTESAGQMA